MNWKINKGVHIGHAHAKSGQNCQDAVEVYACDDYIVGIVCDGCGGVNEDLQEFGLQGRSEVGANMIASQALRRIQLLLNINCPLTKSMLSMVFYHLVGLVNDSINSSLSKDIQILDLQRFWLSTINGFVMTKEVGYFFRCGDGIYQQDDNLIDVDQNNAPHYLAYAALYKPENYGISSEFIPKGFDLVEFNPNEVDRIMVASDGFNNHNYTKLAYWRKDHPNEELPDDLNGLQWGKKGQFGMKKWMNKMSMRGYFDDDCAIITAEKIND